MFTPEINFLKERPDSPITTGGPIPEVRGGGDGVGGVVIVVGILIAVAAAGASVWGDITLRGQVNQLEREQQDVEQQLTVAQAELDRLTALRQELDGIEARTDAFKSFFSQIQPWSAILQDMRGRVPAGVWISGMSTAENSLLVSGGALTFPQVNDFQLTLLQSPFVDSVLLNNSGRVPATEETNEYIEYILNVTIKPLDLPSEDLVANLENAGSSGLVEKIRILRNLEAN